MKVPYINTEDGICISINGKYIPIKDIADHYGFEIQNEDDIYILIDAISSVTIEGAKIV